MPEKSVSPEFKNPDFPKNAEGLFSGAPFAVEVGVELVRVMPGEVEARLILEPKHCQQYGHVHAGVVSTLADHTAGTAAMSVLDANHHALTVEFKINFLRVTRGRSLRCVSSVLKTGRTLLVIESEVYAEDDDREQLVAKAMFTFAVIDQAQRPK